MVGLRNRISIESSVLMHIQKRINEHYDDAHEKEIIFLHMPPSILFGRTKEWKAPYLPNNITNRASNAYEE